MSFKKKFKNRKIKKRDSVGSLKNLEILDTQSFYHFETQSIVIKFRVPNNKFNIKNIFNITKTKPTIAIHISDGTEDNAQGHQDKENLLCGLFYVSDITKPVQLSPIKENQKLEVFVINDKRNLTPEEIIEIIEEQNNPTPFEKDYSFKNDKEKANPKEVEGGVIVEGP